MTTRGIRIPDELWSAAVAKAAAEGVYVSEVVREALERYVADKPKTEQPGQSNT